MKTFLYFVVLLLCPLLTLAEVKVTNVSVKSHWPWNGLVDITYSIECKEMDEDGNLKNVYVDFTAIDDDRNKTVPIRSLTGQGAGDPVKDGGPYTVTWDVAKDAPNFHSSNLKVQIHAIAGIGPYMVVDLVKWNVRYTSQPPNLDDDTCRTTELWLRKIQPGKFIMGSPETEIGHASDEIQHEIQLTQIFYIGIFECTQEQWKRVMGTRPSYFFCDDCYAVRPVEQVSYEDIRGSSLSAGAGWPTYGHVVDSLSFMGRIKEKTGVIFDLPTEAQWEYACRAGTITALNSGKNLSSSSADAALDEVARNWYNGGNGYSQVCTFENGTAKVGSYQSNAWGLYDMHGNVFEWCLDWYGAYRVTENFKVNPKGVEQGSGRIIRGGGWVDNNTSRFRSAYRYGSYFYPSYKNYNLGFRIVSLLENVE